MSAILVIDDDADIVQALELVLSEEGHHVLAAHDRATALAAVRAHRPAMILVDWNLPGTDTAALIRELRKMTGAKIALATGAQIDERHARVLGADLLLKKPYGVDSLLRAVGESEPDSTSP